MALTTAGLISYDVWVAVEPSPDDTISEILSLLGYNLPIMPFAWGILASHFFVRRSYESYPTKLRGISRYLLLGTSGLAVGALSIFDVVNFGQPLMWLGLGSIVGWMFWPQFKENFPESE